METDSKTLGCFEIRVIQQLCKVSFGSNCVTLFMTTLNCQSEMAFFCLSNTHIRRMATQEKL